MSVRITKDNVKNVEAAIRDVANQRVLVGIPAERTAREDGEPINNAQLGYIHNYGAPEANIPARPFMEPGVAASRDMIVRRMKEAGKAALEGRPDIMDKQLNAMGAQTADEIRNQISRGLSPPLAEATLRRRKGRAKAPRQGEMPLIDFGYMLRSITYVIRLVRGR